MTDGKDGIDEETFEYLKQGLCEMVDHIKGKPNKVRITYPKEIDPQLVRAKTGLSQNEFAKTFNISVGTLKDWEQGRTIPNRQAQSLLKLINADPEFVLKTLAA